MRFDLTREKPWKYYADFRGGKQGIYTKKTSTYVYVRAQRVLRVQRVQGLDRQAERTAMLTLASCVLLLLLMLLLCRGRRTAAADVVHQYK